MSHGICTLSVIPCRAEPNDRAEIVTQLLFGELYHIIEKKEKWVRIKTDYDQYEAWICIKQLEEINQSSFTDLKNKKVDLVGKPFETIVHKKAGNLLLPLGADLRFIEKEDYHYQGIRADINTSKIKEFALAYLNTPYLWGGRSPGGIDCSGFSQLVYKLCGIKLPRDAYQQAELGEAVSFVANATLGDLAFFDNEDGHITHVGIILEDNKIIHASGKVRIDIIDHQGIYNEKEQKYTHQLRTIKRYF